VHLLLAQLRQPSPRVRVAQCSAAFAQLINQCVDRCFRGPSAKVLGVNFAICTLDRNVGGEQSARSRNARINRLATLSLVSFSAKACEGIDHASLAL
jgi:hypothetical protein